MEDRRVVELVRDLVVVLVVVGKKMDKLAQVVMPGKDGRKELPDST